MKKLLMVFALLFVVTTSTFAVEGMWLLPLIKNLNIADMKAKGFKLEAEDIYNANGSSMLDAVAVLANGCSTEVVSENGLVLTNHHCGYGFIQKLASAKNDYIKNGYWSMNYKEELPCDGLTVIFTRKISDVTTKVLSQLPKKISEEDRKKEIAKIISAIEKETLKNSKYNKVIIKPLFEGNQYIMFEMEEYSDIRLVAAPPTSIGKFGGDTDNWMWPRHTGDFTMFRIYADSEGKAAAYSADNKPLSTPNHFPISIKGVKEGDFAMVIGSPGSTSRYMPSYEIANKLIPNNKARITVRGVRQETMLKDMRADESIFMKYTAKYISSSNYWKNAIGMNQALEKLDVISSKQELEKEFTTWVESNAARKAEYGEALDLIKYAIKDTKVSSDVYNYITESIVWGIEMFNYAFMFREYGDELIKNEKGVGSSKIKAIRAKLDARANTFYKDYNNPTDQKVAKAILTQYFKDVEPINQPAVLKVMVEKYGSIDKAIDYVYENSFLRSRAEYDKFMASPTSAELSADPAVMVADGFYTIYKKHKEVLASNSNYSKGKRIYTKGLIEMLESKGVKTYPDANFSVRMTYGNVLSYLDYNFETYLSEVLAKEDPSNPYEFTVEPKLKELYKKKRFGKYGDKDVTVNFITDNDITGGNSGSPVINGNGELIGIAFDGNWEAMSGDILFEKNMQRTISVDIRYVLFLIDKVGKCDRLIKEMTIVEK